MRRRRRRRRGRISSHLSFWQLTLWPALGPHRILLFSDSLSPLLLLSTLFHSSDSSAFVLLWSLLFSPFVLHFSSFLSLLFFCTHAHVTCFFRPPLISSSSASFAVLLPRLLFCATATRRTWRMHEIHRRVCRLDQSRNQTPVHFPKRGLCAWFWRLPTW